MKIGSTGCGTDSECADNDCLIVGDGLSLVAGNQIHGPQIHGASHSCGGTVAGSAFTQLHLGSGLQLSQPDGWDDYCMWQIDVCQSGLKIGATGCDTERECADQSCVIVGEGLSLVEQDGAWNKIQGPKIGGHIFTDITLEGGLSIVEDDAEKCTYTLSASGVSGTKIKVNENACEGSIDVAPCTGLDCLTIGKDLKLTGADGNYTLSSCASGTSGLQIGSTGCGTESECSGYDCLIVGDGLSLVAGNQIHGPKIGAFTFTDLQLEGLSVEPIDEENTGKCIYKLKAEVSGTTEIKTNSDVCEGSVSLSECTGLDCLTIGKNLKLEGEDGNYTLESCATGTISGLLNWCYWL